jgi:hypothetical protein
MVGTSIKKLQQFSFLKLLFPLLQFFALIDSYLLKVKIQFAAQQKQMAAILLLCAVID